MTYPCEVGATHLIIGSTQVLKVFWDCRRDATALFHQHDVRLGGVLDLQLADIALRTDSDAQRQSRLSPFFWANKVAQRPEVFR
jgi:hypothetical protein